MANIKLTDAKSKGGGDYSNLSFNCVPKNKLGDTSLRIAGSSTYQMKWKHDD